MDNMEYDKTSQQDAALGWIGGGSNVNAAITKEENKEELLKLIKKTEDGMLKGLVPYDKGLALIKDIRVSLNNKFEMERSDDNRRIIVVPQKHLYICPHTNRECSNMPPKEVCIKHYNLIERTTE